MNNLKDTEFYNEVSETYSETRYPRKIKSYNQFFFTRRLELVINLLKSKLVSKSLSLFEIGCADGIVVATIYGEFSNYFSKTVAVDISPSMIDVAKKKYSHLPIDFKLRNEEDFSALYNIVLEVGVINYANIKEELDYIYKKLTPGGFAILSYAGNNSLWNKIKPGNKGYNNFVSYQEFETNIEENFVIEKLATVGLFIPLIWKIPILAKYLQLFFDSLISILFPSLFHEKIYLLRKRA